MDVRHFLNKTIMWRSILVVILVICAEVQAFPQKTPYRNSIFSYERQNGRMFMNVDVFDKTEMLTRDDNLYRLPNTTKPVHYNIWWKVNISPPTLTFSGTVDIDLHATQPGVNRIVIHSKDLTIESLTLTLNKQNISQTYSFDSDHQFLIINLVSESLQYNADNPVYYRLTISFGAPLRTDMSGFYRSWYMNYGKIHWMATTQFGETFARSAYPCYDEPALKASFNVTVTRPKNFKSWSNMKLNTSRVSVYSGYVDDMYYITPVMSTYLLAVIVAEYDSQAQTKIVNGTEQVVYELIGRPDAIQTGQSDYMFNLGQSLFQELIEYTDIDYYNIANNMKLTHAAIPDFNEGGMENWGLITYREPYLMYDANNTDTFEKQFTTMTLTHESSHQWFGDLVTFDWWDAVWLNEGFATFFGYYIADKITDMDFATLFINDVLQSGLLSDSFTNPQPLTNPVTGSPSSVSRMFSNISYRKGAAVIRMTDHLMGSENHKLGLRKYLKARAYQTALPSDLFNNLQESALETGAIDEYGADFNIVDYYTSWTEQGGHPILNVTVDRQAGVMTIRQFQFNINSGYTTPKNNWIIPITFATASNPNFLATKPTYIITEANTTLNIDIGENDWIIFNLQQTGFYRVNYDERSWDLIINLLRGPDRELVHEYNRAQIVDDVFQFARAKIMTYNRAFNIMSFLRNETAYTPWLSAIGGFNYITYSLKGAPLEQPIKNLFMEWASNLMEDLTYLPVEGEQFLRTHLRLIISPIICRYGGEECISTARSVFADYYNWGIEVPINVRPWIFCNALREGNPNHYQFLYNRYFYHPVNTEQVRVLTLLGCTTDETSLRSFLDIFNDNYVVRPQDLRNAYYSAVSDNAGNTQIAFRYMQENLKSINQTFGSVSEPLSYVSSLLRSEEEVKQFQDWATQNKEVLGDSYQSVFNNANGALDLLKWAASYYDDMNSYLTKGDTPAESVA
ncbi:hypothetical protein ACJJTC_018181 [Scirpophaga incertulas]